MWCDCAHYVLSDIDHHSDAALAYLNANASTRYTISEFKRALSQEYFPQSIDAEEKDIISDTGKYSIKKISKLCNEYLLDIGAIKAPRPAPKIIDLK